MNVAAQGGGFYARFDSSSANSGARIAFLTALLCGFGQAATPPSGFAVDSLALLSSATAMAFAPDGRLFICQQGGTLRVYKNGTLLTQPFLTVAVDSSGERGLLGVAFDPGFASNQFVYIYYTVASSPRHNRVSRFTASGDVAVPGSEAILFDLDNLSAATNHNGGAIHFGVDGKLYIAAGDNANGSNSQSFSTVLGKILRINADGTIPPDNPFFSTTTGKNRAIWALGLRNPFTFDIQRGSGKMFINDVGETSWEEIDDGRGGANYGWPVTEGSFDPLQYPQFRNPLLTYPHFGAVSGCAITGGAFYNPVTVQFPATYLGSYFYADLCSGWIRRFQPWNGTSSPFLTGANSPVDLKIGPEGALYYLERNGLSRVRYTGSAFPKSKLGVYVSGQWFIDANGNGRWDGPSVDRAFAFTTGDAAEIPVAGDWNGSGVTKAGAFVRGVWFLDVNGNGLWDGPGIDELVEFGGPGSVPVVGDWDHSGITKIGVFQNGVWLLDINGNHRWDGPAVDKQAAFGNAQSRPVAGDWNGSGASRIGVFQNGVWLLDVNGNFSWDGPTVDRDTAFGTGTQVPVTGDWAGAGRTCVGVFGNGVWALDGNGNFLFDPPSDQAVLYGAAGQVPVPGQW